MPVENTTINNAFHKLIMENDLPKVVFHSIRHTSITYKLKLNGGDIKSVQGDSGHSQAKMVTDQYSHILDEDRKSNARIFEQYFYSGHKGDDSEPEKKAAKTDGDLGPEDLLRILQNPEMAAFLIPILRLFIIPLIRVVLFRMLLYCSVKCYNKASGWR